MNKSFIIVVGILALLIAGSIWGLRESARKNSSMTQNSVGEEKQQKPLVVFCAAASRAAMEEIVNRYRAEFNREVQVEYGSSQVLLNRVELASDGDLYIPSDSSFLDLAAEKKLVAERIPIAAMKAVVAVAKGNPNEISSMEHLTNGSNRLVQANPDAAAIGKATRVELTKLNLWEPLKKKTTAFRGTVTDVANDVKLAAADAGIVFDAVLATYPQLEAVELPELKNVVGTVEVGVLSTVKDSQAALHLARYITAKDRGLESFSKLGFKTMPGDQWADRPQLDLFAGSMLRPAIEETLKRFQDREGVSINTVYNGCGILVTQMKTGQRPDAYFACDVEFMKQVADLFPEPVEVSQNELVILVQKGNPHKIAALKDLTREGLRVGIGHEKKCAMGWITQVTLKEGGVQQEVMKNVTVESPTGDLLVNHMRAGSLDAAVVYLSNAAGAAEVLEAIAIQGLPCSTAIQPWAVYKESKYPQTASRLFHAIVSPEGRADFEAEGFGWQLK
ncbi:MAG: molybdate ABC transporter substrate-binding protein [Pirellulales bacterium]